MANVLLTGATGFIGRHLARTLLDAGHHVACLRRKSSRVDALRGLDVAWAEADVTAPESLPAALRGIDVVYHLAGTILALRREEFFRVNEGGARNLLQTCAALQSPPTVVLVSSLAAGGPQPGNRPRCEDDPPAPVSLYGQSKLAGERAAAEFARYVPLTIVRPPIVFGPADRVTLEIFKPIARFGIHLVPGYGPRRFSLLHVDDVCRGLILAAERGQRVVEQSGPGNGNSGIVREGPGDRGHGLGDVGRAASGRRQGTEGEWQRSEGVNQGAGARYPESGARGREAAGLEQEAADGRRESDVGRQASGGGSWKAVGQGIYYFAAEEDVTYAELGRRIGAALGRRRTICIPTAIWLMRLSALGSELIGRVRGVPPALNLDKAREAAAGSWTCTPARAKQQLGWSCAADLTTRIQQTADWYKAQGWL